MVQPCPFENGAAEPHVLLGQFDVPAQGVTSVCLWCMLQARCLSLRNNNTMQFPLLLRNVFLAHCRLLFLSWLLRFLSLFLGFPLKPRSTHRRGDDLNASPGAIIRPHTHMIH